MGKRGREGEEGRLEFLRACDDHLPALFLSPPGFLLFAALTVGMLAASPSHLHLPVGRLAALEAALARAGRRAARAEAAALHSLGAGAHKLEAVAEKALRGAWAVATEAGHALGDLEAAAAADAAAAARRAAAALLGGRWPTPRWPALVFMAGALTCLGTSATCHLFGCCSEHVAAALWRGGGRRGEGGWERARVSLRAAPRRPPFPLFSAADYAGIVTLIVASFVPPVVYGFECAPAVRNFYLTSTSLLGVAVLVVSMVPFFQAPRFRALRATVFTGLGGWGVAPAVHGLLLHWHEPAMVAAFCHYAAMGALYLCGAIIFATRVPERWAPGKFDVWGHSHQLFHVAIVAAAAVHYRGVRVLLAWRDTVGGLC